MGQMGGSYSTVMQAVRSEISSMRCGGAACLAGATVPKGLFRLMTQDAGSNNAPTRQSGRAWPASSGRAASQSRIPWVMYI